jgi:transketolase
MRNAFADEITRLGQSDPRIVLLSGDIGNKLFDKFKEHCPGRFFNCGVAEGNMMGVAAGLAMNGLRPVVYTITPFTTTRCFEQIRVDACYHNVPVTIVGTGAGLSYAELGPTHHSCEDIAILRTLPGMTVLCPCDSIELRLGLRATFRQDGPVYMRIGKKGEPNMHAAEPDFRIGRSITMRPGSDVCLISTGNMMPVALKAADMLQTDGISARVESFHTVKPLDIGRLEEIFASYSLIATTEEHSGIGGLAGAVAEWYALNGKHRTILSFSVADEFMHETGTQDYARRRFGLTAENMFQRITQAYRANA